MNPTILLILLVITIAIAVSQLGVIIFFVNFLKKNELSEGAVKDAQVRSASVIADAVEKATKVVTDAEETELKKVTEESAALTQLTQKFEQNIQSLQESTKASLESSAKKAESSYGDFVAKSEKSLESMVGQDQKLLDEKTNQMITQSSTMFEQFMGKLSQDVKNQLQGEIDAAKKEVDVYKQERIEAINAKIVDILEEVLVQTLSKKLTLKDEGEFVFQALETAKKENAL